MEEKLYYLKNTYGEYKKYTKEERIIKEIFIDECNQALQNNIDTKGNIEENMKNILGWSREIENCVCNVYTIEEIIEKLNKEHNWAIEIYQKIK